MCVWRNIVKRSALNLSNRILRCRMTLLRKCKTSKLKQIMPNVREQWQRNVREGFMRRNVLMFKNLFIMWFNSFHFYPVIISTHRFFKVKTSLGALKEKFVGIELDWRVTLGIVMLFRVKPAWVIVTGSATITWDRWNYLWVWQKTISLIGIHCIIKSNF